MSRSCQDLTQPMSRVLSPAASTIGENAIMSTSDTSTDESDSLAVRPPVQRRSRESWTRALDAGVAILEEGGYDAFTIAAVCERASIPPRAIYARVDTKDALFLAVYEHGLARARAAQDAYSDDRWTQLNPAERITEAVNTLAGIFREFDRFLGAIVLVSGAHSEVNRRGARYVGELADLFVVAICGASPSVSAESRTRTYFHSLFSTLAIRVAYGPEFLAPIGDEQLVDQLIDMGRRYLID